MRAYFLLRKLSLTLRNETEKYLPLTNTQNCVHIDDNLDLSKLLIYLTVFVASIRFVIKWNYSDLATCKLLCRYLISLCFLNPGL